MIKAMMIISIVPYMMVMLLIGVAIANASIYWQSILQIHTPDDMAGRVFSISSMIGNISLPLAYGIFGLLLTYSSIGLLMGFFGIFLLIVCALLLVVYRNPDFSRAKMG